jgi:uncharacterized membrane protein HdeD (DUF308 family)
MTLFDPYFATRRNLKVGLAVAGVVAGAVFGVALTVLGKIVAGAPPATLANYAWNAGFFGVMAGVISPLVTWSALRRAPLWRTVVEPLVLAVAGAATSVALASPVLLLVLPPIGLALGFAHVRRAYSRSVDAIELGLPPEQP